MAQLQELAPEPWGSQVRRARRAAELTYDQATERINLVYSASRRSIARLEDLDTPPSGPRQILAFVALLAYGFDPARLGLAGTAAERLVDRERILSALPPLDLDASSGGSSSAWFRTRAA